MTMAGDLNAYLASRYLVADTKPSKKRKRKNKDAGDGLLITDDDAAGWTRTSADDDGDGIDGAGGATVVGTSAEFRKAKKSGWRTLGGAAQKNTDKGDTSDAAAADAILSAAAAETEAALAAQDEAPVVEGGGAGADIVRMSDGTHAGLQSAASVMAQLERRRREERAQYEQERRERRARRRQQKATGAVGADEPSEGEEEVVYRDATGRRVDIAMRRQQVRQAAAEAEQKERAAQDALRGDVQRAEAQQRREQLAEAALMPVARGADDEELNRALKSASRWNDPMAAFLQADKATGGSGGGSTSKHAGSAGARTPGRPVYPGPAAPNRYGIRPGYRWDGVDRGNGFEADRFKAINRRARNKDLEYEWQMDA